MTHRLNSRYPPQYPYGSPLYNPLYNPLHDPLLRSLDYGSTDKNGIAASTTRMEESLKERLRPWPGSEHAGLSNPVSGRGRGKKGGREGGRGGLIY